MQYPQHMTTTASAAVLQRVDASVAIAGELQADLDLNVDFGGSNSDVVTAPIPNPSSSLLVTEAVTDIASSSAVLSVDASLPPPPPGPFDTIPESAPSFNPYTATGLPLRAGFIPCIPPPLIS